LQDFGCFAIEGIGKAQQIQSSCVLLSTLNLSRVTPTDPGDIRQGYVALAAVDTAHLTPFNATDACEGNAEFIAARTDR